jgi:hypothetical protein
MEHWKWIDWADVGLAWGITRMHSGVERTGLHQKVSARFSICSVIASRAWDKIIFLRVLLGLTKLEFSAIFRSKQATPAKYVTFVHFVAVSGQLDPQF